MHNKYFLLGIYMVIQLIDLYFFDKKILQYSSFIVFLNLLLYYFYKYVFVCVILVGYKMKFKILLV